MSRQQCLPPNASSLSASMRDLGYSLETAVADIVDNSISAGATEISVFCDPYRSEPVLAVIDNGCGMNEDELIAAMRYAVNPLQQRSSDDLGRFGLGLKTASFSQCRKLTVISKRNGEFCGAEWDLDLIEEQDEWILTLLDADEIRLQPYIDLLPDTGTLVIWRKLDRLCERNSRKNSDDIICAKLDLLEKHLGLVYHRFLASKYRDHKISISICVNNHQVKPFDPFFRENGSDLLPHETFWLDEDEVRIQAYILPHYSRLSKQEQDKIESRSHYVSNQGVFIYRNGRLIAKGGWFGLKRRDEETRLARIQIDYPGSLDHRWTVDIKKSSVQPPHEVKERISQLIPVISGRSIKVLRGKSKNQFDEVAAPVWERYVERESSHYVINQEHPLVKTVADNLDKNGRQALQLLLRAVSAALPLQMIYEDYAVSPQKINQSLFEKNNINKKLHEFKSIFSDKNMIDAEEFIEIIRSTRLFDHDMEAVQRFIGEEFQ